MGLVYLRLMDSPVLFKLIYYFFKKNSVCKFDYLLIGFSQVTCLLVIFTII